MEMQILPQFFYKFNMILRKFIGDKLEYKGFLYPKPYLLVVWGIHLP